jgi:serine phosphatase RsbU (regulator of sigma subunit)
MVGASVQGQDFELSDEVRELQQRYRTLQGKDRYEAALQIGNSIQRIEENQNRYGASGLVVRYYEEAFQLANGMRDPELMAEALMYQVEYALKARSIDSLQQLIGRLERIHRQYPQPKVQVRLLRAEGMLALMQGDTALIEQKAQIGIEVARKAQLYPEEVHLRLDWVYYLKERRRFQESLHQAKLVLALEERKNDLSGMNSRYEDLSFLYNALGHADSANLMMARYFESALRVKDPMHLASVTLRIGNHYAGSGKPRKGIPYFLISQRLLDSLRVAHRQQGSARMVQDAIDVAVVRGNLAGCYLELEMLDSCAFWIHKAHYVAQTVQFSAANNYFNLQLANLYFKQNRPDSAQARADSAVQALEPYGPGMDLAYLLSLAVRGYLRNRFLGGDLGAPDLLRAYQHFLAFRKLSPDARRGPLYYRRELFAMLAEGLHEIGSSDPALQVLAYYALIMDNFRAQAQTGGRADAVVDYELKARDHKIEVLELQQKLETQLQRRQYLYLGAGGLLLVIALLFAWTWVRRNRERQLQNRLLVQENQRVEQQNAELESASQELRSALEQLQEQQRLLNMRQHHLDLSIHYAFLIQTQFLGNRLRLNELAGEHLLFNAPRDVVSGDFYWWRPVGKQLLLAVIDCTGHGVPGALMSVMAFHLLEEWIEHQADSSPAECLAYLDRSIRSALKQDRTETALDGMDLAYVQIDWATGKLRFAGARRPLYLRRDGQWMHLDGARKSIGGRDDSKTVFETRSLLLRPGDRLFAWTDGITDQFGGLHRRKLGTVALLAELSTYDGLPLTVAEARFTAFMASWRGGFDRLDDALLLGLEFQRGRLATS